MDALSLLCTLHADGPATLRRLRASGCSSLTALLTRDAAEVAERLGLEPAAARRLLREGRILAERLGEEVLEAEEAAPASASPVSAPPAVAEAPAPEPELGPVDEDLVARIVSAQPHPQPARPDPAPAAPAAPTAAAAPEPAPEAAAAAAVEPDPEPAPPPARDPEQEPEPAATGPLAPDALTVGALPGLDAAMVEDLAAAGITTMGALGAAESLMLTRDLGVTFAQARRLRFLARRAARNLGTAGAIGGSTGSSAPVCAAGPAATPPMTAPTDEPPVVEVMPRTPPTRADRPEPAPEPALEPALRAGEPPAPAAQEGAARAAFWEPRPFLEQGEEARPDDAQGVKVDPSEIEARPRFGEQFARAARQGKLRSAQGNAGRTVLGWNFEIPRPAPEEVPLASFGADGAGAPDAPRPEERETSTNASGDEGAGPFA